MTCQELFHFCGFLCIHACAVNVLIGIHKVSTTAGKAGKAGNAGNAGKAGNWAFLRIWLEKLESHSFSPTLAGKAGILFLGLTIINCLIR